MKRQNKAIHLLTVSSVFAALIFAATAFIRIPTVFGYIHPGDGFIFIAAVLLPLHCSLSAAMIGTCLADLISGYAVYIPATLIIKALTVLIVSAVAKRTDSAPLSPSKAVAACVCGVIGAGGYYLYEALMIAENFIAPLPGILLNLMQTLVSYAIYVVFFISAGRDRQLLRALSLDRRYDVKNSGGNCAGNERRKDDEDTRDR